MPLLDGFTIGAGDETAGASVPSVPSPAPAGSSSLLDGFKINGATPSVSDAVDSLPGQQATYKDIPGLDISKTDTPLLSQSDVTAKYGTASTISQAPQEGLWGKIGDFFSNVHDFIYGDPNARNQVVQSKTDIINNQPYVDIAKQLGIDKAVNPTLPKGIDPSEISPDVLQYYKEQAAGNVAKNNWAAIQKANPDLKLPDNVTPEQVDKAMGVNPNSELGTAEALVTILGTAALTDTGIDIAGALTEGGIKVALPQIVSLAKNVGIFTTLDKAITPLREELVKKGNIGDGGQALLYVAQQAGSILATHGADKGIDKIVDLFAKHTIEGYTLPKTVTISGEDIRKITGTDKMSPVEIDQMGKDLGWSQDQTNALKNGASVTTPSYKVITTADKPWWGKVKDFFGFEPTNDTTISKTGAGMTGIAGEIGVGPEPITTDGLQDLATKVSGGASDNAVSNPAPETPLNPDLKAIAEQIRASSKSSVNPNSSSSVPEKSDNSIPELLESLASEAKNKTLGQFGKDMTSPKLRNLMNETAPKGMIPKTASAHATGATIRKAGDYLYSQDRGAFDAYLSDIQNGRNMNSGFGKEVADFHNKANGLDEKGNPIDTTNHGTTDASGRNEGLRESSQRAGADDRAGRERLVGSVRRNIMEAAGRLSGHAGEDGEGAELLARHGQTLSEGKPTRVDEKSVAILREAGFPSAVTDKLSAAEKAGGVKNVVITDAHEGNENYIGAYKTDTLYLNPTEINHSSYQDGSIVNHELAGHSWYLKLDQDARRSFYNDVKENKVALKQAWETSDNPHKGYWARTVAQIREKVLFKSNEAVTARIMDDFGLISNGQMSLDSFIDESLNLDKTIAAINAELARVGREPIDLESHNTQAAQEHIAMLAERAGDLTGATPAIENYLDDVEAGTLKYGPQATSQLVTQEDIALSLKTLEKLKGRTTVSKQFISDLTNAPDLKQQERDVIRQALETESDTVNVPEFTAKVQTELLPLETVSTRISTPKGIRSGTGVHNPRYENISLPKDSRGNVSDYKERIYQSSIKTSAGNIHFDGNITDSYFGHSRIEDMADGTTRRVIEVQSDLFQKGRLEKEFPSVSYPTTNSTVDKINSLEQENRINYATIGFEESSGKYVVWAQEEPQDIFDTEKEAEEYINKNYPDNESLLKSEFPNFPKDSVQAFANKRNAELRKLLQYSNPTAHFRMVREEIKQAAKDGKTALQFPTGETAMKIEGLGQDQTWSERGKDGVTFDLTPSDLKVGKTVTTGGDGYGRDWIITNVGDNGKFDAIPKDYLLNPDWNKGLNSYNPAFWNIENALKTIKENPGELSSYIESFDISGKVDTNNPIYRFYEKDLGRYLKNNYDAKPVIDDQGVSWYQVPIKPEMATEPVTAFRESKKNPEFNSGDKMKDLRDTLAHVERRVGAKSIDPAKLENMLNREKQSLAAYNKNPTAHEKAYGQNKKPIYKAKIAELEQRIADVKEATQGQIPTINIGGTDTELPKAITDNETELEIQRSNLTDATSKEQKAFEQHENEVIAEKRAFIESVKNKRPNEFAKGAEELYNQRQARLKQKLEEIEKAKSDLKKTAQKYGMKVEDYAGEDRLPAMTEIISTEDYLKRHPAKPFLKYLNGHTGLLPQILEDTPGVYGTKMKALLKKSGFSSVADAQKSVDNYLQHVDLLNRMIEDVFNPLELVDSKPSDNNVFEAEKARLENDPTAKPLSTIVQEDTNDKYPLKKKVGAIDYLGTPKFVFRKMGLGDEMDYLKSQYRAYLKELPENIAKIKGWIDSLPKEVDGKPVAQRIFDYLDGTNLDQDGFINPDFLTVQEKKVGDEIKAWLSTWADRLHIPLHERLTNYITHVFEDQLIQKEFDEDLAKIIRNKIPGEVYDPFLQKRLGTLGYKRDVWKALEAYVKRATRKVNMDPALEQIKIAAKSIDSQSETYVMKYIAQVNKRPTDTENLLDTTFKQWFGYRAGARPTARLTSGMRRMVGRAVTGLNPKTAIQILMQGANTYAKLGERHIVAGYAKIFNPLSQQELKDEGILGTNVTDQDKTISATKKFWQTTDKVLYFMMDRAIRINKAAAYFGAKSKYYAENSSVKDGVRIFTDDASEDKARDYARNLVEDTQFDFGAVDIPVLLGSDLSKTLLQFSSYNTKQAEFFTHMARQKDWKGMLRYVVATIALMLTIGKALGIKWSKLIPFSTFSPVPPAFSAIGQLGSAALGLNDQYGQKPSAHTRLQNAIYSGAMFVPGGVQLENSIKGYQSAQFGNLGDKIKSTIFGADSSEDSDKIFAAVNKNANTAKTQLDALDPSVTGPAAKAWEEVKRYGIASKQASQTVKKLDKSEYAAYKLEKASDTDYQMNLAKKVLPVVQQAQKLDFTGSKANALVRPLSSEEYDAYKSIKSAIQDDNEPDFKNQSLAQHVAVYAKALGTSPETVFDDFVHGDFKIVKQENGQVIVTRMPESASEAVKKKAAADNKNFKLDHAIPLEVGGTNRGDNLQVISTQRWAENTPVEDFLGKALDDRKITGSQAREYIIRYKAGQKEPLSDNLNNEYKKKYKGEPLSFEQIQDLIH